MWSRYSFVGVRVRGDADRARRPGGLDRASARTTIPTIRSTRCATRPRGCTRTATARRAAAADRRPGRLPRLRRRPPDRAAARASPPTTSRMPELQLLLATDLAVLDHRDGTILLIANVIRGLTPACRRRPGRGLRRRGCPARRDEPPTSPRPPSPSVATFAAARRARRSTSGRRREDYMAAVETAKEHIRAGDAFQVVVSQRFETDDDRRPARRLPGAARLQPVAVHVPAALRRPRRRRLVARGAGHGRRTAGR